MARSGWRLLAVFLLMFAVTLVVPGFLRAQDAAADRFPAERFPEDRSPADRSPIVAPVVAQILGPVRGPVLSPIWIPPPNLPRHYPDQVVSPVFQQLVRSAGIIFSGRVTFVGGAAPASGLYPESTTVTFRVDQAVRGASPGQILTIREWAGLRNNGERYYVGERVFLFLYSPGKLGLTSPVAGGMGRFAMNSQGNVVMSPRHVVNFVNDPILGGKTIVTSAEFAQAVLRSSQEE
jgi:hypothetical protein